MRFRLQALLIFVALSVLLSAHVYATTGTGLSFVLENKANNSLAIGYHNLTVTISTQYSCTSGVFFNQTFVNGIVNGRSNVTLSDLSTNYNQNYFFCYYIDGSLMNGIDTSTVGQGLIHATDINSSDDYAMNSLDVAGTLSAGLFSGLFSWTVLPTSSRYLGFNQTDLFFNETSLNATIDSRLVSVNSSKLDVVDQRFNETALVNGVQVNLSAVDARVDSVNVSLYNLSYNVSLGGENASKLPIDDQRYNETGLINGVQVNLSQTNADLQNLTSVIHDSNVNSSVYWGTFHFASDLNNLIISSWQNITGRPTYLSNFTDDLGNRGYTSLNNFSNDAGFITSTFVSANYTLISDFNNVQTNLSTVNTRATNLNTSIGAVDTRATNLNTSIGTADTRVTNVNSTAVGVQGNLSTVDTRVTNLNTSIGTVDTRVTNLNTSIGTIDTRATNLNTSIGTVDTRVTNLNGTLGNLTYNSSIAYTATGPWMILTAKVLSWNVTLADLTYASITNFGLVQTNLSTVDTRVTNVNTSVGTVDTRATNLNTSIGTLDTRATNLNTSIGTVDTRATNLNTSIGAVDTRVTNLNTTLVNLTYNVSTHSTTLLNLTYNFTVVDTRATNLNTSIGTVDVRATNLNTSIGTVDTRATNINTTISNVQTNLSTVDTRVTNVNTSLGTADTRVTTLNTSISTVDTRATNLNTSIGTVDTRATNINTTAVAAMPKAGGTFTGNVTFSTNVTLNGNLTFGSGYCITTGSGGLIC